MSYDFFLCYSHSDRDSAQRLYAELKKHRATVFLDKEELQAGDAWQQELVRALQVSAKIIILISKNSSHALFQREEVLLGIELVKKYPEKHRLCPVFLDKESQDELPESSFGLRAYQAIQLLEAGSFAQVASRLVGDQVKSGDQVDRATLVIELEGLLTERESSAEGATYEEQRIDELARQIRDSSRVTSGAVVAGSILERVIGGGNFGTIWLARATDNGEFLATKVFDYNKLTTGIMLWRFRRSIAAIQHLNRRRDAPESIIRIHKASDDGLAFSMDYISDGNLESVALKGWSVERKIEVFLEIGRAVHFAHRTGVIHRDIKPANVVMATDGTPVLTDFDISDIQFVTRLSVASGGLGTPVFAAPEQLEDADAATEQSDVYSLGRLLHFLLLERRPSILIQDDPELPELSPFDPALVEVIRKSTRVHPSNRFPDVGAMIRAVEEHQTGLAFLRTRLSRVRRWIHRNRTPLLFLIGLITLLIGMVVYQARVASREARLRREIEAASMQMAKWQTQFEELQEQKGNLRDEISRLQSEAALVKVKLAGPTLTESERALLGDKLDAIKASISENLKLQASLDKELEMVRREVEAERRQLERIRMQGLSSPDDDKRSESEPRSVQREELEEEHEHQQRVIERNFKGSVGQRLHIDLPRKLEVVEGKLPPGMSWTSNGISGVPQRVGEYELLTRSDTVLAEDLKVNISISNNGCPMHSFARCGDHCVALHENPFHYAECFTIAPDLRRAAAEQPSKPPPWIDKQGAARQFYRLYYQWDEGNKSIIISSIKNNSGWSQKATESPKLEPRVPAAVIASESHLFVTSELAISCDGPVRVADYRASDRGAYEKLSTGLTWRRISGKDWSPTLPNSTDSKLRTTLAQWLDLWREICVS